MKFKNLILQMLPVPWIRPLKKIYYFNYTSGYLKIKVLCDKITLKHLYNNKFKKFDLIIYDTIFPNTISGFRFAEFNFLLEKFVNSKLIVNPTDYVFINQDIEDHKLDLKSLQMNNPNQYSKTLVGNIEDIKNCKLFYCVFLNNIYDCLKIINKKKINFVFTLYPGGGFDTKNVDALKKLREVLSSQYLRGIIVTQDYTKSFLQNNFKSIENKICYISGGIVPQNSISSQRIRRFDGIGVFNICFCAAKNVEKGLDKGYDIFIDVAKILIEKGHNIHFSIVGGFDKNDIDVTNYSSYFTFYGYKKFDELKKFYLNQDVILSPNRPFIISEGSFDGFPMGTVIEAAFNGVVPIVTDELHQNNIFSDDEIIITTINIDEIVYKIEELIRYPKKLAIISEKSQKKFRELYDGEIQMAKRVEFLKKNIYDSCN